MTRSDMINELLEDFGYEKERFRLTWVSSAEPDKFVEAVTRNDSAGQKAWDP
jgi:F420-non-reducing hydrogenase iron-sulfur subunit